MDVTETNLEFAEVLLRRAIALGLTRELAVTVFNEKDEQTDKNLELIGNSL